MNGVEILASSEVVIETAFNWQIFWIFLGGILVLSISLSLFFNFLDEFGLKNAIKVGVIVGLLFGIFTGIVSGFGCGIPLVYETQYKVIVSNEVQMNDFVEKYEIIDQEGKIYTVRERQ